MKIHIVQQGETLHEIARKYNMDPDLIKEVNKERYDADSLAPGSKVRIPSGEVPVKRGEGPKKKKSISSYEKKQPKPSLEEFTPPSIPKVPEEEFFYFQETHSMPKVEFTPKEAGGPYIEKEEKEQLFEPYSEGIPNMKEDGEDCHCGPVEPDEFCFPENDVSFPSCSPKPISLTKPHYYGDGYSEDLSYEGDWSSYPSTEHEFRAEEKAQHHSDGAYAPQSHPYWEPGYSFYEMEPEGVLRNRRKSQQ